MFAGLSVDEMVELRLDLLYMAQKVERGLVARLSQKSREKNSVVYTADQLNGGKLELEHAHTMIRGSAKQIQPTLAALAEEPY